MEPGHPFRTEALDEMRASQRRLLLTLNNSRRSEYERNIALKKPDRETAVRLEVVLREAVAANIEANPYLWSPTSWPTTSPVLASQQATCST